MAKQTLAVKYRPKMFEDVVEQEAIKVILRQQLESNEVKNAYLFCGGAGTGKTTCARIFANEINDNRGNPIEMDAASNSGVDDVRSIIQQAQTKSLDSEYKVFIIDECHSISNTGWQAFLKLIEEPPAKSIFIFCTTDPQKIPKTILSRVQRYDFHRISQKGIVDRLLYILHEENEEDNGERGISVESVEYIAKIADGGMRDAITMMDKCLAYSTELTVENVIKALGTTDYSLMIELTDYVLNYDGKSAVTVIETIHNSGKDVKQFIKQYMRFLLDIAKFKVGCDWSCINLPKLPEYVKWAENVEAEGVKALLSTIINLNSEIKYSTAPKYDIEATLLLECDLGEEE